MGRFFGDMRGTRLIRLPAVFVVAANRLGSIKLKINA
jgi:hypothetical protein